MLTLDYRDVNNASNTDLALRRALADQILDACMNVGFFYGKSRCISSLSDFIIVYFFFHIFESVKNHGIPEETINKALEAAQIFFALPDSSKIKVGSLFLPALRPNKIDLLGFSHPSTARHSQIQKFQGLHFSPRREH